MMMTLRPLFIGLIVLIFAACDSDDTANRTMAQEQEATLEGRYALTTLDATPAADLNSDGMASTDLFAESNCFDVMEVTFNMDGTFMATNSRLDFNGGANNDELTCTTRTDNGMWMLDGNTLTLSLEIDGETFMQSKNITVTETTFSLTATRAEVDQYVDGEDTSSASEIDELFLEYTKQ